MNREPGKSPNALSDTERLAAGLAQTRRQFFGNCCRSVTSGIGLAALGALLAPELARAAGTSVVNRALGMLGAPHFAPRAHRIIYLFMAEGPSQVDLFDYKPAMANMYDKDLPDSIVNGQRLTTMTSGQARFPVAPSIFKFAQHGKSGAWVSELLPHTATIVDDIAIIKSLHTEAINHDPAITFMNTGAEQPGRPSMGAWLSYGLGSANRDLPAFVVLHSSWTGRKNAQALFNRLWGTGFLPSEHQGTVLRAKGDPVLYLTDPPGICRGQRRTWLDSLGRLNGLQFESAGDPETQARIAQYEMAYRMQASVPDLTDLSTEPASTFELYGPESRTPGTFAANCLLARRLAERDVRFIQVYIRGWDQHEFLPRDHRRQCSDVDQGCAALIKDLKQRGLLEDTLVVWGGEFGRTIYSQGPLTPENYGRDHHPRCFTMWMAGAGVKPGIVYGETDDFSYNITANPVHVHDLNATILHLLGIDHEQLTYRFQGRDFRLTDVHGKVVHDLLV
ncbi:MAG: DUF1501 domain-containing protein [Planctomycetota bacterium]